MATAVGISQGGGGVILTHSREIKRSLLQINAYNRAADSEGSPTRLGLDAIQPRKEAEKAMLRQTNTSHQAVVSTLLKPLVFVQGHLIVVAKARHNDL